MSDDKATLRARLPLPVITGRVNLDGSPEVVVIHIPQMTSEGFEFLLARLDDFKTFLVGLDSLQGDDEALT